MTTASDQNPRLVACANRLQAAIEGERLLVDTIEALGHLIRAVACGYALDVGKANLVSSRLFSLAPRLVDVVSAHLTPEHVHFALGCANASLRCRQEHRRNNLIAYVALLRAELQAVYFRTVIASGDQCDLVRMTSRNTPGAAHLLREAPSVH